MNHEEKNIFTKERGDLLQIQSQSFYNYLTDGMETQLEFLPNPILLHPQSPRPKTSKRREKQKKKYFEIPLNTLSEEQLKKKNEEIKRNLSSFTPLEKIAQLKKIKTLFKNENIFKQRKKIKELEKIILSFREEEYFQKFAKLPKKAFRFFHYLYLLLTWVKGGMTLEFHHFQIQERLKKTRSHNFKIKDFYIRNQVIIDKEIKILESCWLERKFPFVGRRYENLFAKEKALQESLENHRIDSSHSSHFFKNQAFNEALLRSLRKNQKLITAIFFSWEFDTTFRGDTDRKKYETFHQKYLEREYSLTQGKKIERRERISKKSKKSFEKDGKIFFMEDYQRLQSDMFEPLIDKYYKKIKQGFKELCSFLKKEPKDKQQLDFLRELCGGDLNFNELKKNLQDIVIINSKLVFPKNYYYEELALNIVERRFNSAFKADYFRLKKKVAPDIDLDAAKFYYFLKKKFFEDVRKIFEDVNLGSVKSVNLKSVDSIEPKIYLQKNSISYHTSVETDDDDRLSLVLYTYANTIEDSGATHNESSLTERNFYAFIDENFDLLAGGFSVENSNSLSLKIKEKEVFSLKSPQYKLSLKDRKKAELKIQVTKKKKIQKERNLVKGKIKILKIPMLTNEGTTYINGVEKVALNQFIRSPGVYFAKKIIQENPPRYSYDCVIISESLSRTKITLKDDFTSARDIMLELTSPNYRLVTLVDFLQDPEFCGIKMTEFLNSLHYPAFYEFFGHETLINLFLGMKVHTINMKKLLEKGLKRTKNMAEDEEEEDFEEEEEKEEKEEISIFERLNQLVIFLEKEIPLRSDIAVYRINFLRHVLYGGEESIKECPVWAPFDIDRNTKMDPDLVEVLEDLCRRKKISELENMNDFKEFAHLNAIGSRLLDPSDKILISQEDEILKYDSYKRLFRLSPFDEFNLTNEYNLYAQMYEDALSDEEGDALMDCFKIGEEGRYSVNKKFHINLPKNVTNLVAMDYIAICNALAGFKTGETVEDDMDHLKNKRVRSLGGICLSIMKSTLEALIKTQKSLSEKQDEEFFKLDAKKRKEKLVQGFNEEKDFLEDEIKEEHYAYLVHPSEDSQKRGKETKSPIEKLKKELNLVKDFHGITTENLSEINYQKIRKEIRKIEKELKFNKLWTLYSDRTQRKLLEFSDESSFFLSFQEIHNDIEKFKDVLNFIRVLRKSKKTNHLVEKIGKKLEKEIENIKDNLSQLKTTLAEEKRVYYLTGRYSEQVYRIMEEFIVFSPISQYYDQINPLAELALKRKISVFGPDALIRGFIFSSKLRDIHPSQNAKVCSLETPDGDIAGLLMSLATLARVNSMGRIETAYYKAENGYLSYQKKPIYLDSFDESETKVVFLNSSVNLKGKVMSKYVSAKDDYIFVPSLSKDIKYYTFSPFQLISVGTSLVPFIEHDDGNRALMGSNMQRQAQPLLHPQKPIVGTGLEMSIPAFAGVVTRNYSEGEIVYSSSVQIIVKDINDQFINYSLKKYLRSNQGHAIVQTPIYWKGEHVFSGQILADGPGTFEGELALGRNLSIGYIPYDGYNYEDAIVINENLVLNNILTSLHIEHYEVEVPDFPDVEEYELDVILKKRLKSLNLREKNINKVKKAEAAFLEYATVKETNKFGDYSEIHFLELKEFCFAFLASKKFQDFLENQKQLSENFKQEIKELKEKKEIKSFHFPNFKKFLLNLSLGRSTFDIFQKYFPKFGQCFNLLLQKRKKIKSNIFEERAKIFEEYQNLKQTKLFEIYESLKKSKNENESSLKNEEFLSLYESLLEEIASAGSEKEKEAQKITEDLILEIESRKLEIESKRLKTERFKFDQFKSETLKEELEFEKLTNYLNGYFWKEDFPNRSKAFFLSEIGKFSNEKKNKEKINSVGEKVYDLLRDSMTKLFSKKVSEVLNKLSLLKQQKIKSLGKKYLETKLNEFQRYVVKKNFITKELFRKNSLRKSVEKQKEEALQKFAQSHYSMIPKHQWIFNDLNDGEQLWTRDFLGIHDCSRESFDENGVIKLGTYVKEDQPLLGNIQKEEEKNIYGIERLASNIYGTVQRTYTDTTTVLKSKTHGRVIDVGIAVVPPEEKYSPKATYGDDRTVLRISIAHLQKIEVGDKLSGRHGNKGVISRIVSNNDMPILPDGSTLDILVNPLGVPSRMNVGQILECLLGFAGEHLSKRFKVTPFDEMYGNEASTILVHQKLKEARKKTSKDWLFNLNHPGKVLLRDGRTGEFFDNPTTIGRSYILKLVHMVDSKIHTRDKGPYSKETEQPVKGRALNGGQRLGEMEVWALEAHGCAWTLQELLTIKSDDMDARQQLDDYVFKSRQTLLPRTFSETFVLLINEFKSLGLNVEFFKQANSTVQAINAFQLNSSFAKERSLEKVEVETKDMQNQRFKEIFTISKMKQYIDVKKILEEVLAINFREFYLELKKSIKFKEKKEKYENPIFYIELDEHDFLNQNQEEEEEDEEDENEEEDEKLDIDIFINEESYDPQLFNREEEEENEIFDQKKDKEEEIQEPLLDAQIIIFKILTEEKRYKNRKNALLFFKDLLGIKSKSSKYSPKYFQFSLDYFNARYYKKYGKLSEESQSTLDQKCTDELLLYLIKRIDQILKQIAFAFDVIEDIMMEKQIIKEQKNKEKEKKRELGIEEELEEEEIDFQEVIKSNEKIIKLKRCQNDLWKIKKKLENEKRKNLEEEIIDIEKLGNGKKEIEDKEKDLQVDIFNLLERRLNTQSFFIDLQKYLSRDMEELKLPHYFQDKITTLENQRKLEKLENYFKNL